MGEAPFPVVKAVSYGLAHAPSMVRYGSKPSREIARHGDRLLQQVLAHLRTFQDAIEYPPNQAYVGGMRPEELTDWPVPWRQNPVKGAKCYGAYGAIIEERELYARLIAADHFDLVWITDAFADELRAGLWDQATVGLARSLKLRGHDPAEITLEVEQQAAVPLYIGGDRLIGCMRRAHDVDEALSAPVVLENLACKATGVQALATLLHNHPELKAQDIDYLIGCGEEAVGDRYQRGGGNIAKAMGEEVGCVRATGADLKAFCCSPVHALVVGAALVRSGVFSNVVVLAGGSFAKLGMKFRGHLSNEMPILEDVLGSMAVWIGPDDGVNPRLRLDHIGRHTIGAGSSTEAIARSTVIAPLDGAGLRMLDVDRFAVEMHNPEVTEPAGSGNVPYTNYRLLASLAVSRGEIAREAMAAFIREHGLTGFAPTQGHIPSAVSYLGHARDRILSGELQRVMFSAKGSLFLGRMTELSDGISVMLERNGG